MKKLLFTLAIGLATLTSCESDLVSAPPNDNAGVQDVSGLLLKQEIITYDDGSTETTTFTNEGNRRVSVSSDGVTINYTYVNDKLDKISGDGDETQISYDNQDRIISIVDDSGENNTTYVYNADNTVTETEIWSYGGDSNTYIRVITLENSNIVNVSTTHTTSTFPGVVFSYTDTYTYDDKYEPDTNIHQARVFIQGIHGGGKNNILSRNRVQNGVADPDGSFTNVFTYNDQGYPLTEVRTSSSFGTTVVSTTEYVYE